MRLEQINIDGEPLVFHFALEFDGEWFVFDIRRFAKMHGSKNPINEEEFSAWSSEMRLVFVDMLLGTFDKDSVLRFLIDDSPNIPPSNEI